MTSPPPLLAIAHGSRDPRAAAAVAALLDLVRRRAARLGMRGLEVVTAYADHGPPTPARALGALHGRGADLVVALPLLLTDAYHSKTDIPAMLRAGGAVVHHGGGCGGGFGGSLPPDQPAPWPSRRPRAAARRDQPARWAGHRAGEADQPGWPAMRLRYGQPLGPHPLLVSALERRLAQVGVRAADSRTAVVLAAAGSTDPAATEVIARLARDWRRLRGWRAVLPAYARAAAPSPADAVATLLDGGAARVVVASYLLAPGLLADEVRDRTLAAGASAVSPVLGAAAELADIVLLRYRAALAGVGRPRAAAAV